MFLFQCEHIHWRRRTHSLWKRNVSISSWMHSISLFFGKFFTGDDIGSASVSTRMDEKRIGLRWWSSNIFELNGDDIGSASVSTRMNGLRWCSWNFFELNHLDVGSASVWTRIDGKTIGLRWWSRDFWNKMMMTLVLQVCEGEWMGKQLDFDDDRVIFSNWIIMTLVLQVCEWLWIGEEFYITTVGRSFLVKIFGFVRLLWWCLIDVTGGGHDTSERFFDELFDWFQLFSIFFLGRIKVRWEFAV